MPNSTATFQFRLSYTDTDSTAQTAPAFSVAAPHSLGAQTVGGIDVPDAATASTEYSVPFGAVGAATGLLIENRTGQDLAIRLNGQPANVSGALVSGTKTMALAAVTGEKLSVEMVTSGGTPGILSVRRSSGNVIVESWLAGTGIQTSDTSTVKVVQNAVHLFQLPDLGALAVAMPAAAGAAPLASASVILTDTQSGAGTVGVKVFGDPA